MRGSTFQGVHTMMHSVENRFIAIVCGAMLVFIAPLLVLFLSISSDRIARERIHNIELLMAASAEALGKPSGTSTATVSSISPDR